MSTDERGIEAFQARSGVATLSYIVATKPFLEKAIDGRLHPTSDAAFDILDGLGAGGEGYSVYEILVYVARAPMARPA